MRHLNNIPPRKQWNNLYGFCGEVSFISAGLYYGQYCSQYDARALDSSGENESKEDSQLLLGVNDDMAAVDMHLRYRQYGGGNTSDFMTWVKKMVLQGYPAIIGVYMNNYVFYGSTDGGDGSYDHIVPVIGVSDDTIIFSDNGLWTPDNQPIPYVFEYKCAEFPKSRDAANQENAPVYSLPNSDNCGIVIVGINDPGKETLPVQVFTDVNYEEPEIGSDSGVRPKASALSLTVTVSGLTPGESYNIYRYSSFESVPDANFNKRANQATKAWAIKLKEGDVWTATDSILSSDIAIYRAVKA